MTNLGRITLTALVLMTMTCSRTTILADEERVTYFKVTKGSETDSSSGVGDWIMNRMKSSLLGKAVDETPATIQKIHKAGETMLETGGNGLNSIEQGMAHITTDSSGDSSWNADDTFRAAGQRAAQNLQDEGGSPVDPIDLVSGAKNLQGATLNSWETLKNSMSARLHNAQAKMDGLKDTVKKWVGLDGSSSADKTPPPAYDDVLDQTQGLYQSPGSLYDPPSSEPQPLNLNDHDVSMDQALRDIGASPEPGTRKEDDLESARICMDSRLKGIRDRVNQLVAQVQRLIPHIKSGGFDRLAAERLKNQGCWIVSTISDAYRWCGMPMERTSQTALMQEAARNICQVTFPTSDEAKKDEKGSDGKSGYTCSGGPCYWLQCDKSGKCTRTYTPPKSGGYPSNSGTPPKQEQPSSHGGGYCTPESERVNGQGICK